MYIGKFLQSMNKRERETLIAELLLNYPCWKAIEDAAKALGKLAKEHPHKHFDEYADELEDMSRRMKHDGL